MRVYEAVGNCCPICEFLLDGKIIVENSKFRLIECKNCHETIKIPKKES
jgi:hypothetical protein